MRAREGAHPAGRSHGGRRPAGRAASRSPKAKTRPAAPAEAGASEPEVVRGLGGAGRSASP